MKTFAGWDKDKREVNLEVRPEDAPEEYIERNLEKQDVDAWHEG